LCESENAVGSFFRVGIHAPRAVCVLRLKNSEKDGEKHRGEFGGDEIRGRLGEEALFIEMEEAEKSFGSEQRGVPWRIVL
jgi:hypothetical protein